MSIQIALDWARSRTIRDAPRVRRRHSVSVVLPARDEAATIGTICRAIVRDADIDELIVIDGGSTDATISEAQTAGARVVRADDVLSSHGPALGKGDSMWRSLAVTTGDIVVWLDADVHDFDPQCIRRLVAPLDVDPSLAFTKAFYRRPIAEDPDGGGRVTELLARPLLGLAFPELGGFLQPLAGEYAGRRDVLERLPFFTGYSVEVGLLVDLLFAVGLDAMAQVDLGSRRHRNRRVPELAPAAHAIARAIVTRAEQHGRLLATVDELATALVRDGDQVRPAPADEIERPPMVLMRAEVARP